MRAVVRVLAAVALLALAAPAVAQTGAEPTTGLLTVDFFEVGQGDAILIRTPEGKTALVDAGPSSHQVMSLLRERGVTALDLAVVSHHHADHYGGMADVVRSFHPRAFLATGSSHTSEHYLKLLQLVRERGIQAVGPAQVPRKITLGSAVLTVFPQAPGDLHEENNNSLGLRLDYGQFSVLLPGDAERDERLWWERTVPALCARA